MSYAGLPAGFSVAEKPKSAQYHGLPEGFQVQDDKGNGWGDALLKAPAGAINEIGGALKGAGSFLASLPDDPLGYKIGRAVAAAPEAIGHAVGDTIQYARNLSPPQFQGNAPSLGTGAAQDHPWLAMVAGDNDPMKQMVAQHPLALVGDAAMAAGLTGPGRAALGGLADAATVIPRKVGHYIADLAPANRAENALLTASKATPGSDAQTLAAALEQNRSPVAGVNYSAAQATQDPAITQLEKGSRMNRDQRPAWAQFDTGQNTALFNALHGATASATDEALGAARGARDAKMKYNRQAALALAEQGGLEPGAFAAPKIVPGDPPLIPRESIGPHGERVIDIPDANARPPVKDTLANAGQFSLEPDAQDRAGLFAAPVRNAMESELGGPRGALPSVQRLVGWLNKPDTLQTPGRAYEARKVISDALNAKVGVPLDELGASVKSAGVSSGALKGSIDTALDKASGGLWQQYLDGFAASSKDVNSTQALNNIRSELEDKINGGAVDGNGNPKITRAYLKQVIERNSTNKYGDLILPGAKNQLDNIMSAAQQMEAPQLNYRMAATGGGGSDTASNAALIGANHLVRALGPVGRLAAAIPGFGETGGATQLAALLQNPTEAAQALRTAAAREASRRGARSSGLRPALLAAALNSQQQ